MEVNNVALWPSAVTFQRSSTLKLATKGARHKSPPTRHSAVTLAQQRCHNRPRHDTASAPHAATPHYTDTTKTHHDSFPEAAHNTTMPRSVTIDYNDARTSRGRLAAHASCRRGTVGGTRRSRAQHAHTPRRHTHRHQYRHTKLTTHALVSRRRYSSVTPSGEGNVSL